uniref:Cystatin domain-containing protein n=1 Tax=Sciurus vulgaris TaxID=55149 RepID=A0A8D2CWS3_SCIVU
MVGMPSACTMSCLSGRRAFPQAMQLLFFGLQFLVTPVSRATIVNVRNIDTSFPAMVEFTLHSFNQQSKDEYAYRLVCVLNSWRRKMSSQNLMVFSMKLKLRHTKCGKFEDDIENCPFQDSSELNNTFICYFTISTKPWITEFGLLNKTCSEELP